MTITTRTPPAFDVLDAIAGTFALSTRGPRSARRFAVAANAGCGHRFTTIEAIT